MAEHVIYVDRFQLREGKLEDFKQYAMEMAEFVEKNEPGVISFNYYLDEDGVGGTAVFVFSDAEALDVHLDVASSRFQEGYELLSATEIELLGHPSDRAIEMRPPPSTMTVRALSTSRASDAAVRRVVSVGLRLWDAVASIHRPVSRPAEGPLIDERGRVQLAVAGDRPREPTFWCFVRLSR